MSAGFSRAQVQSVAALANLELTDTEVVLFAAQLGKILDYAEQLQQIDTDGIPPTASVVTTVSERTDVVQPSLDREAALANAPDPQHDGGLFKVPRVIG